MKRFVLSLACALVALTSARAQQLAGEFMGGCRKCRAPTLRESIDASTVVFVGAVETHQPKVLTLRIQSLLKDEAALDGRRTLDVTANFAKPPTKALVFGRFLDGQFVTDCEFFDPSDALVKYVKGVKALDRDDRGKFADFYFRYLEDPHPEVAYDSLREYSTIEFPDLKRFAKNVPPEQVAKWLERPDLDQWRARHYGLLLGLCGTEKHVGAIRKQIDQAMAEKGNVDVDGQVAGCFLLSPKEGAEAFRRVYRDKESFAQRYSALRGIRFVHEACPDRFDRKAFVEMLGVALGHSDVADFVIHDLRRVAAWESSDQVLDLYGKKGFSYNVIKRAALQYALRCPTNRARALVAEARGTDAELVQDAEDLLNIEESMQ